MAALSYVGRPFSSVEPELRAAGTPYQLERTRPVRDFFKTDERCLYVVRARELPDGTRAPVLAASLQTSSEINL